MATKQEDETNGGGDPYMLLNVARSATPSQIRKAYFALARHVHPDRNPSPDAAQSFQTLGKAYGILSDPEKRKLYDRTGCTDQDSEAFWDAYQHYRTVYPEVTQEDVEAFAKTYRNSDEEKTHLRQFYKDKKGDLTMLMAHIMCSSSEDAPRFVAFFESEISLGTLHRTAAYDDTRNKCGDLDLDSLIHEDDIEEIEEIEESGGENDEQIEEDEEDDMGDFIVPDNELVEDVEDAEVDEVEDEQVEDEDVEIEDEDEEEEEEEPVKPAKRGRAKRAGKTANNKRATKKPKKSSAGASDMDALRAMMMERGKARHGSMMDNLMSKYS